MIPFLDKHLNRKVRVFISSSFKEMNAEREIIVNSIFPRLRKKFAQRHIDVVEVDLRWGIQEELFEDPKILEICIDEVIRCRPFFVGLIGNTYGKPANLHDIEKLPPGYREAIGNDLMEGISVTELEMRAGVFVKNNHDYSVFLIRRNDRIASLEPPIENLIAQIDNNYRTISYEDYSEFENSLYAVLNEYIEKRYSDVLEPPYSDNSYFSHLRILHENAYQSVINPKLISKIKDTLSRNRRVYLFGEKGSGKTSCISYITQELGTINSNNVFFHYGSAGRQSTNLVALFRRMRTYIEYTFSLTSNIEDHYEAITDILLNHKISNLYCIFDAIELYNGLNVINKLFAFAELNENVFVLCAGTTKVETIGDNSVSMVPLSSDQIQRIVNHDLARFGKHLTIKQISTITNNQLCSNPLFLKTCLMQLRTYGDHDSFNSHFIKVLSAESIKELFILLIERLKEYYDMRGFSKQLIDKSLGLLLYSYHGVTEGELQAILQFDPLARCALLSTLDPFLIEADGILRFNHDLIVQAVASYLENKEANYKNIIYSIAIRYFSEQGNDWRKYTELPFLYNSTNDLKALMQILMDARCFKYLLYEDFFSLAGYVSALSDNQIELFEAVYAQCNKEDQLMLAELLCFSGCYDAAIKCVHTMLSSSVILQPFQQLRLHDLLARSIYKQGQNNFLEAIIEYQKLLSLFSSLYPDDSVGYASRAYLLGVAYKSSGKLDESYALLRQCADIFLQNNVVSATAAWSLDVYAGSLYCCGEIETAEKMFNRAAYISKTISGPDSLEVAWADCYSWQTLYSLGRRDDAKAMVYDAYRIYNRAYKGHGVKLAWAALNAGNIALASQDIWKATKYYKQSIVENDKVIKKEFRPHVYSLTAYCNLACLYEYIGDHSKAVSTIEYCCTESAKKNGAEHIYTTNFILCSGIINQSSAAVERAIESYSKTVATSVDLLYAKVCLTRITATLPGDENIGAVRDLAKACYKEFYALEKKIPLLEYLVLDTYKKTVGTASSRLEELSEFQSYKFYVTHNNASNVILIPAL